jgi:hypothetical protein
MKKQLYIFGTAMVAMVFLLSGCSITKRHYSPGYHVEWHKSGANHLAKEEVSKDFKNGKEEELIVHSHEESKQLQNVISPIEGQVESESMITDVDGFGGEEDPSTERARVENISENASNQFNQSTEEKTEDNSGSMEDKAVQAPPTENNIFALLGLIFSIVPGLGLLGLIFSLVGLSQIKKDGGEGKKLAIAGIIIVGVKFILWCLYFALVVFAASQGY